MSFLLAFIGLSLLIILHEAGHYTAARICKMRVERFSLFLPPLIIKKKMGESEWCLGLIPLGGYVKIAGMGEKTEAGDGYQDKSIGKRLFVILAGPAANVFVAIILFVSAYSIFGQPVVTKTIAYVKPPASNLQAGQNIKPGDELISVDNKTGSANYLFAQISSHGCLTESPSCQAKDPVDLTVRRGGNIIKLSITPVKASDGQMRVGIGPRIDYQKMSLGGALVQSGYITGKTVMLTGQALARLPEHKEEVSGVVGTYEVTRQFISSDIMKTLLVLGLISLSLAIINLLPLLPLDGGHAFWLIVEAIRRKPASEQTMFLANALGFCFIIGLFFLGLSNDISSIQNGGFKTR